VPPGENSSTSTRYYGELPARSQQFPASSLLAGFASVPITYPSQGGGPVIASLPGVDGNVWHGPYTSVAPGDYLISIRLLATVAPNGPSPSNATPILTIHISAWGQSPWVLLYVPFGYLAPGVWTTFTLLVQIGFPSANFEVVGDQISLDTVLLIGGVSLAPAD